MMNAVGVAWVIRPVDFSFGHVLAWSFRLRVARADDLRAERAPGADADLTGRCYGPVVLPPARCFPPAGRVTLGLRCFARRDSFGPPILVGAPRVSEVGSSFNHVAGLNRWGRNRRRWDFGDASTLDEVDLGRSAF